MEVSRNGADFTRGGGGLLGVVRVRPGGFETPSVPEGLDVVAYVAGRGFNPRLECQVGAEGAPAGGGATTGGGSPGRGARGLRAEFVSSALIKCPLAGAASPGGPGKVAVGLALDGGAGGSVEAGAVPVTPEASWAAGPGNFTSSEEGGAELVVLLQAALEEAACRFGTVGPVVGEVHRTRLRCISPALPAAASVGLCVHVPWHPYCAFGEAAPVVPGLGDAAIEHTLPLEGTVSDVSTVRLRSTAPFTHCVLGPRSFPAFASDGTWACLVSPAQEGFAPLRLARDGVESGAVDFMARRAPRVASISSSKGWTALPVWGRPAWWVRSAGSTGNLGGSGKLGFVGAGNLRSRPEPQRLSGGDRGRLPGRC